MDLATHPGALLEVTNDLFVLMIGDIQVLERLFPSLDDRACLPACEEGIVLDLTYRNEDTDMCQFDKRPLTEIIDGEVHPEVV